jgi:hypothetical protein
MATYFIKKNEFGTYQYRISKYVAWSFMPDSCTTRKAIINYLTENGRLNEPEIIFTNNSGRLAKIYDVSTLPNGTKFATMDGEKHISLYRQLFLSDAEATEFFKGHQVSDEIKEQGELKTDIQAKLSYYKDNADAVTLELYEKLIAEKFNDKTIIDYLKTCAATYEGAEAIITFQKTE